jgi:hypothetical protein
MIFIESNTSLIAREVKSAILFSKNNNKTWSKSIISNFRKRSNEKLSNKYKKDSMHFRGYFHGSHKKYHIIIYYYYYIYTYIVNHLLHYNDFVSSKI